MLVDDDDDIRLLLRMALVAAEGIDIVGEAVHGRAAIEVVEAAHPDVVLLDLNMPIMSGLEALPLILASSPAPAVVVFTASEGNAGHALAAGATACLNKTASVAMVAAAIRAAVRTPRTLKIEDSGDP